MDAEDHENVSNFLKKRYLYKVYGNLRNRLKTALDSQLLSLMISQ